MCVSLGFLLLFLALLPLLCFHDFTFLVLNVRFFRVFATLLHHDSVRARLACESPEHPCPRNDSVVLVLPCNLSKMLVPYHGQTSPVHLTELGGGGVAVAVIVVGGVRSRSSSNSKSHRQNSNG